MAVLSRQHDPRLGPSSYIRIGRLAHEGDRWFESHSLQWRVHGPHDAARGAPFRAASRSIRYWRLGSAFAASVCSPRARNCTTLQRNLVYTGVTRGKRLVVLIGQRTALAIAVKGARTRRRWSKLGEWLGRAATTLMPCAGSNPG